MDFFDPDNGHIRYYGDNKAPGVDPAIVQGNSALLDAFRIHSAMEIEIRKYAVPIIFFERVGQGGRHKGFVRFQGCGIIERVQLVTQYDRKNSRSFPNYVFDFAVFDLSSEQEEFSWEWITKRRHSNLGLEETNEYAPKAWKVWQKAGSSALNKCRRKVSKLLVAKTSEQVTPKGSGFVSGGQGKPYSQALKLLFPGSRVFVNIPKTGYVGVGIVKESAVPLKDFKVAENVMNGNVIVGSREVPLLHAPLVAP